MVNRLVKSSHPVDLRFFFFNCNLVCCFLIENGTSRRSNISVEFFDLGFRVRAPGDLSPIELDSTLDLLYSRVKEQENNQVNQVSQRNLIS